MPICIWCKLEVAEPSVEHIIPEALGCPEGFTLTICRPCNNGLAHLDQAVIDDFDFFLLACNVPRKGGRPPAVENRGNMIARLIDGEPTIVVNTERHAIENTTLGRVGRKGGSARNVDATWSKQGDEVSVSISMTIGQGLRFVRGIAKIAFSSFAFHMGTDVALNNRFDWVRDYVLRGTGKMRLLVMPSGDLPLRNEAYKPWSNSTGVYLVPLRLMALSFMIDLSFGQHGLRLLEQKAQDSLGASGWTIIPT